MNTSVRPNALELDGWNEALPADEAANDRDLLDDHAVSGEHPVVATTRPPPPDFAQQVSILRLRPIDDRAVAAGGREVALVSIADGQAASRARLDSADEITRPLPPRSAGDAGASAPASARTALRIGGRVTIHPPPPRAEPLPVSLGAPPRASTSARSGPSRRRRVSDRGAIAWSRPPRAAALGRSARSIEPRRVRGVWAVSLAAALILVTVEGAVAREVAARWSTEVVAGGDDPTPHDAAVAALRRSTAERSAPAPTTPAPLAVSAPPPPPRPTRFDARAAREALVESALRAAACTDPHGGTATAAVTFVPDGRAAIARVGGRYTGTTVARCIEQEMKGARVAPFVGQPVTLLHVVRLPGDAKGGT